MHEYRRKGKNCIPLPQSLARFIFSLNVRKEVRSTYLLKSREWDCVETLDIRETSEIEIEYLQFHFLIKHNFRKIGLQQWQCNEQHVMTPNNLFWIFKKNLYCEGNINVISWVVPGVPPLLLILVCFDSSLYVWNRKNVQYSMKHFHFIT